jgi:3-oxoacyl-[acyl-carrier protein] reductase
LAWTAGLYCFVEEVVPALDVLDALLLEPHAATAPAATATHAIAPDTRLIPCIKAPLARTLPRQAPSARRPYPGLVSSQMGVDELTGRVALVTGGSGGIGGELSLRLAQAGAEVAIHYASNRQTAEQVAEKIAAGRGRAVALAADLSDAEATTALVSAVEQRLGPVDLLVANAGLSRPGSYEDVDAAAFDQTLAVNLRAPYLLARRVLPGMRERKFGRILFTSSVAALTGGIVGPHYAASKAGLHGLMHFLAARAAADGVTVNAIAPALIEETGMLPGDPGDLRKRVPVGRLGKPDEVADLALAVLRNGYITNHVMSVDGGIHPR